MGKYREDDITLLLPSVQKRTQNVLDAMKADGYEPVLFDGLRTAEEAVANSKKGTGLVDSIHRYGAAVDIICNKHGWSCRAKKCKFYQTLKRHYKANGFVCGADFSSVDEPHGQAVFIADQDDIRALGTSEASAAERESLVRAFFELRTHAMIMASMSKPDKSTIIAFQQAAGLIADGIAGPRTAAALKRALRPL